MTKGTSRVWRWRWAVKASDLDATTRQVLGCLSDYMDENGGSCFPSIADICADARRAKNTVRNALAKAQAAGWIAILPPGSGGLRGQKWKRKAYVARWPDALDETPETDRMEADMTPEGGSIDDTKVGQPLTQDKTSPRISPNARAGVREAVAPDRRKIDAAFWKWLPTWPRPPRKGPEAALRTWRALTDEQRDACMALTPGYLRAVRDKARLCGPETYLRRRLWEVQGVQVKAPFRGPLWMACYLWRLLQPPIQTFTFTLNDERMIADGFRSREALTREKRRKFGWPMANRMVALWHERKPFFCSASAQPLADDFVWVGTETPLFAAWAALAEKHDWPLPTPVGRGLFFPRVASLDGDLSAEVEAALADFERRARGIFNGHA